MSNSLAIAAVTATLQSILQQGVHADPDLSGTSVTISPLDKARPTGASGNQLNLFLYQVVRNAAWSNAAMPRQNLNGELAVPPLPLNLYYLLTSFGAADDSARPYGHELLGKAMSILHDHPVLSADDIKAATSGFQPPLDSQLDSQLENVRITLHPITVDELSKLWTGFATQYRLSAAYEVGVALIESTRPSNAPLPILTRGKGDTGVTAQSDLIPPIPTLESLTLPKKQPSALLGDTVTLSGFHLDGTNVGVVFNHPLWTAPVEVLPLGSGSDKEVKVVIPNDAPASLNWPAGFYSLAVLVQRPEENFRRSTNQLMLPLAPKIVISANTAPDGVICSTISAPQIWPEQRATLLLGDRELMADAHSTKTATLTFPKVKLAPGTYYVRLRVDGVDSLLVDRTAKPPQYDPSQKVTVAP
jgi:hypothetical protein